MGSSRSNPVFVFIRDSSVVFVQRLFDSFRWLQADNGENEIDGSIDISSIRNLNYFTIEQEAVYNNTAVVYNLPWMLLPNSWVEGIIKHYNSSYFTVDSAESGFLVRILSDLDNCVTLESLWKEFFHSCKLLWQSQYGSQFSNVIVSFPDYYPESTKDMISASLQSCQVSFFSHNRFLYSSSEYMVYIESSELLFYACLVNVRNSATTQRLLLPLARSDPLHLLTNALLRTFQPSQAILAESDRLAAYRSIRLQLRHHLHSCEALFRAMDEEESDRDKVCFTVFLHSPLYARKTVQVTYRLIESCLRDSSSFMNHLSHVTQSISLWFASLGSECPVVLDGLYASLPLVRHCFQCFQCAPFAFPSFVSHVTEQLNLSQPVLCNDFAFLDHALSIAIQDGFAMRILSEGTPLPAQTTATLFLSLSAHVNHSIRLLRGDSFRMEDLVPVVVVPIEFTPAQVEVGGVEVRCNVMIDKKCNLVLKWVDSFNRERSVQIASDYFFTSLHSTANDAEAFHRPLCGRFALYYQGEMKDGKAHGLGRLFDHRNQLKYEGFWEEGKFSGRGNYYFQDGSTYEGFFHDNCMDGFGVLYDRQGIVVKKAFFDKVRIDETETNCSIPYEPLEEYIVPSTDETPTSKPGMFRYEGERIGGIPSGQGVLTDENQAKIYEGSFRNGLFDGLGKTFFPSGGIQSSGMFVRGKLEGKGKMFSASGHLVVEGSFHDGLMHGFCRCFEDSEQCVLLFEGFYLKGRREGLGTEYAPDGSVVYHGYYYHGNPWNLGILFSFALHSHTIKVTTLKDQSGRCFFGRKVVIVAMNGMAVMELIRCLNERPKCVVSYLQLQNDVAASLTQQFVEPFFSLVSQCPLIETLVLSDPSIYSISLQTPFRNLRTLQFENLSALTSITILPHSLPKLDDFVLCKLPSLQTLYVESYCGTQQNRKFVTNNQPVHNRSSLVNKRFILDELPKLRSVTIEMLSFVDIITFQITNTPLLKYLKIGDEDQTSFCFLNSSGLALSNLPALEEVIIGQGCFTYSDSLCLQSLPSLKRFSAGRDSFFYMTSVIIADVPLLIECAIHPSSMNYLQSKRIDEHINLLSVC